MFLRSFEVSIVIPAIIFGINTFLQDYGSSTNNLYPIITWIEQNTALRFQDLRINISKL